MTACAVDGCESVVTSRGWCRRHYKRWLRNGDPTVRRRIDGELIDRVLARLDKQGPIATNNPELGRCWEWTGSRDQHGYGKIMRDGVPAYVHRVAYELLIGPIPDGMQLDHFACDNGAGGCGNPFHCRPVTQRENLLRSDGFAAVNLAKMSCPQGHPYDEINTRFNRQGWRACRACDSARRLTRKAQG